MRFSLGVNYWPRSSGVAMWQRFNAGEVRKDFAHIAALGLDTVRVAVRWDDFAPAADVLDSRAADAFGVLLDTAQAHGLRVIAVLFSGYIEGQLWLPAWALDPTRPARLPTWSGSERQGFAAATLYEGALLDAQLALARALSRRAGAHAALGAWDIGNAFTFVDEPSSRRLPAGEHSAQPVSEATVAAWSRRIADALRETARAPVTASIDAQDLLADRSVRLGSLCAPLDFVSLRIPTLRLPFARSRLDADASAFLAMLAAAFAASPVFVTAFGNPTCPRGTFSAVEYERSDDPVLATIAPDDPVFADFACLTDDEQAQLTTAVLERLHADGRRGLLWWNWSDLDGAPPFEHRATGRTGLVRADGSEKPVAAALRAFAARQPEVQPPAHGMPVAAAYYYRTLPTSTRTLYDAYLGARGDAR